MNSLLFCNVAHSLFCHTNHFMFYFPYFNSKWIIFLTPRCYSSVESVLSACKVEMLVLSSHNYESLTVMTQFNLYWLAKRCGRLTHNCVMTAWFYISKHYAWIITKIFIHMLTLFCSYMRILVLLIDFHSCVSQWKLNCKLV